MIFASCMLLYSSIVRADIAKDFDQVTPCHVALVYSLCISMHVYSDP